MTLRGLGSRTGLRLRFVVVPALLVLVLAAGFLLRRQVGLSLTSRFVDRNLKHQLLQGLPDGLHVVLCGSGSPLPDATRAGPCVAVIAGKRVYVVDAGEGSSRKLTLAGLSPGTIDAILLTHFHSDHIDGLGGMMLQRWVSASRKEPVPVLGPQGVEAVVQGFNAAFALDKGYRVAHHGEATMPSSGAGGVARTFTVAQGSDESQVVLQQDGLTITAFPVLHTPVFPAVGYRFDYGGRSVVLSGDTAPCPSLARAARGAEVLFQDGLQTALVSEMHDAALSNGRPALAKIMSDIPNYHSTPEDGARLAQEAGVKQLIFYHVVPPLPFSYFNAAFLGDAPRLFEGPITVGKDGLFVSLPTGTADVKLRQLL
jgi:ribonuclease Z